LAGSRTILGFVAGALSGATLTVGIATALVLVLDVDIRFGQELEEPAEIAALPPDDDPPAQPEPPGEACPTLEDVVPPWQPDPDARAKELHLPTPSKRLARRIGFWKQVWGEHPAHVYLFADKRRPSVVHAVVDCQDLWAPNVEPVVADARCDKRLIAEKKKILRKLRKLKRRPTRAFKRSYDNERRLYATADRNILVLEGKADKLRRATERVTGHLDRLERIFATVGVPPELTRLSFVESLFQPDIESHAGAVGAFQFMAATGKEWLMIKDGVDERKDPSRSGWAAAQYMKRLNDRFDSWPLGLTAYNTGPTRMKRLVKRHRTRDIGVLADKKTERAFGFDGQNYYASLAAVVESTTELEPLELPDRSRHAKVPSTLPLSTLARCTGVSSATLIELNPAFGQGIRDGELPVPEGYVLALPIEGEAEVAEDATSQGGEQPS
jgi:membrane-bound lytic murein transglycosylase D